MFGVNPWVIIGAVAAALAIAGGSYIAGRAHEATKCRAEELQREKELLKSALITLRSRAEAAEKLADHYGEQLRRDNELDRLNQERADDTPANDAACLPADAVERLRGIR